ncbi:HNH endonuclease [Salmonella enterica]|uniref:HNH endonuclease signature motif containing protein n=1 Tax=Salmonella enterica TaxID=28901 RepID=UPI00127DD2D2|nr:HNH endonuclease [Salmonella enterica subsp. enterica serovar Schwarzengrund]EEJ0201562.1 HNH endonuclease [Salmonella enterica subsp. enterica]EFV3571917.1 HNH endonuclease [Salmonella enterica]ECD4679656.1 HNH endonuclease [Salmonella enterica subsp. enterica serovar Schwarzengrund]ECF2392697.1 HNH endonuclease [Salmonella enterica subsp. enterica serovar Schwarzengrund]
MQELTFAYLREAFSYDPDSGLFTWKERPKSHFSSVKACNQSNSHFAGKIAGSKDPKHGYLRIKLCGKNHKAHRLAWLFMHGCWPEGEIDHVNGIRDDNRMENLRDVSHKLNMRNRATPITNRHGLPGVSYRNRKKPWFAQIMNNDGRNEYLGSFKTPEEASCAYLLRARELGYHEQHGNRS